MFYDSFKVILLGNFSIQESNTAICQWDKSRQKWILEAFAGEHIKVIMKNFALMLLVSNIMYDVRETYVCVIRNKFSVCQSTLWLRICHILEIFITGWMMKNVIETVKRIHNYAARVICRRRGVLSLFIINFRSHIYWSVISNVPVHMQLVIKRRLFYYF